MPWLSPDIFEIFKGEEGEEKQNDALYYFTFNQKFICDIIPLKI